MQEGNHSRLGSRILVGFDLSKEGAEICYLFMGDQEQAAVDRLEEAIIMLNSNNSLSSLKPVSTGLWWS